MWPSEKDQNTTMSLKAAAEQEEWALLSASLVVNWWIVCRFWEFSSASDNFKSSIALSSNFTFKTDPETEGSLKPAAGSESSPVESRLLEEFV